MRRVLFAFFAAFVLLSVSVVARAQKLGLRCLATVPSPIEGAEGNREFFVELR